MEYNLGEKVSDVCYINVFFYFTSNVCFVGITWQTSYALCMFYIYVRCCRKLIWSNGHVWFFSLWTFANMLRATPSLSKYVHDSIVNFIINNLESQQSTKHSNYKPICLAYRKKLSWTAIGFHFACIYVLTYAVLVSYF